MYLKKALQWLMLLSGGISACNLLTLYFLHFITPGANISILKLTFIALAEKKYSYILFCCVLVSLILLGSVSIKQNSVWLPRLNFLVFLGDLIYVGYLLIMDLSNGYFNIFAICSGVVDIIVVVLLILYFFMIKSKI